MAEIGQLSYSIILNDKDFNRQALEIQKKLKNVDAAITGLADGDSKKIAEPFNVAGLSIDRMIAQAKTLEATFKALSQNGMGDLTVDAQNLRIRWQDIQATLQKYGYSIRSATMEQQTMIGALRMQENTVGQIELKMRALASVRKGINVTEKESIETLKRVNDEYIRLGDILKKVGARQYNLNDMMRNTNGAFSPLGFSIQQVARELPSLTMGAQMFFLAISNNLPILSDELRKAKESYKALIAEGKQATPVWKQVLSSIFSWQTAMVVGITLLTMYGKEIGNWVKGLFGASKANEELAKSLDEINKSYSAAILEGSKNAQKELTNLNLLYKASQNDRISKEERKKAVDELQKQYPSYFKNLTDEQILAGKASAAYLSLSESIIKSARARAAADKITENQSKILDLEAKNTEALAKKKNAEIELSKAQAKSNLSNNQASPLPGAYTTMGSSKELSEATQGLNDLNKEISDNVDQINALNKANEKLSKNINITDLTFEIKGGASKNIPQPKDTTAQQDKFAQEQIRAAEDLQTKIRQAEIDADEDGFEKRMKQMKLNHEIELREIERHREDLLRVVIDNQRKLFEADPKNKGKRFQGFIMPDIANEMKSFNGNVDLLSRKMIDASELVKKGWEDAGEGIATVFSSQFGISDSSGKEHEILVTPILPDGSVLSPSELGDYIDNVLNGSEDILKADNKGIVIAIDVDKNGKAGEKLHRLQELYYGLIESQNEIRLPENIIDQYNKFIQKTKDVQEKELSDELKSLLDKYKDFYAKRSEIDKKYGSDLSILEGLAPSEDNKAKIKELKKQWRDEIKGLSADVDKLLSEEVPTGAGLAFRVSRVLSDVRNNISEKNKQILDAMVAATDEQKSELENLSKIWESAFREEGAQKLDAVAQTYFNDLLKKQKLDIDMGSISSATIDQLNRLRDALKSIKEELSGGGLVDLFESAGLSIENFKQYIDTSSLSATKDSLIKLTTYTPDEVKLTDEQRRSLEAIARILGVINSNQQKGLLDINIAKLNKAKAIADQLVSSFSEIVSALGELADATGNEGLRSLAEDMQFAAQMAQGVGDIVVGIISKNPQDIIKGVTSIATTLIKAEAQYQKARIEFLNSQRELQIEYNKLLIEQIRLQKEGANGVLYEDMLNNFRSAYDSAQSAIKKMDELYKSRQLKLVNNSSIGSSVLSNLIPKYIPTENIQDYLSSISVQTGVKRKKFLGITTGSKAIYGDLLTAFPKLIDEAGNLNLEYAKIVLSQNKFKDNGKLALEELIAYTEQYEESMKSLDDQLSSMFGDIGNLLSESLINAFHNGKLSADEFLSYVNKGIGDMVDNLVTNMVISAVFGDMLNEYKDKIKESLLSDDPQRNLTQLMGQMVNDIASGTDAVSNMMSVYASEKNKAGLGGVGSSDRTGLSGSLARASQESIDELTGVMYAGLEKLSLTSNGINAINITTTAMSAELKAQTALLRSIDNYSSNLPYMRTGIETMVNQGIRIKSV